MVQPFAASFDSRQRELAERVLGRLGYRVTGYSDSVLALDEFRANPELFDAAVTNMSMPGLSGFHLARGLLGVRPDLPIVMTSGCVTREDSATAEELGIKHVLLKPNTSEELGDILHRLLAGRRAGAS